MCTEQSTKTRLINAEEWSNTFQKLVIDIGDTPGREGLKKTSSRFYKSLIDMTSGYKMNLEEEVNGALFKSTENNPIAVRDIDFCSLCEHHMLPFFGMAHVVYIPDGTIIGLSKIPRIVNVFSRRLQVQERLTQEIASCLMEVIKPLGVLVMVNGDHMCARVRGVRSSNVNMVTISALGCYNGNSNLREEAMKLISL